MQRDGKRKWFVMPPQAEASEVAVPGEQTPTFDVYAVLRDHLKYVELIHTELRRSRRNQQELEMKISELSSKVDTLISVAKDLKGRVDTIPGIPAPTVQPDDPEVEALAHRIDDAIAVLQGSAVVAPATPPTLPVEPPANLFADPNSPVPSEPFGVPPANDPNAPL